MSTHPIGKGTTNVTVNMPDNLRDELRKLAKKSGLKLGAYLRAILRDYADSAAVVRPATVQRSTSTAPAAGRGAAAKKRGKK